MQVLVRCFFTGSFKYHLAYAQPRTREPKPKEKEEPLLLLRSLSLSPGSIPFRLGRFAKGLWRLWFAKCIPVPWQPWKLGSISFLHKNPQHFFSFRSTHTQVVKEEKEEAFIKTHFTTVVNLFEMLMNVIHHQTSLSLAGCKRVTLRFWPIFGPQICSFGP